MSLAERLWDTWDASFDLFDYPGVRVFGWLIRLVTALPVMILMEVLMLAEAAMAPREPRAPKERKD